MPTITSCRSSYWPSRSLMMGASLLQWGHQLAKKTSMVAGAPPSPTETLPPSTVSAVKDGAFSPTGIRPSSLGVKFSAPEPPAVLKTANAAMATMTTAVNPARTSVMLLFPPDDAFLPDPFPDTVLRAMRNLLVNASSVRYYTRFDGERPKQGSGGVGPSPGLPRLAGLPDRSRRRVPRRWGHQDPGPRRVRGLDSLLRNAPARVVRLPLCLRAAVPRGNARDVFAGRPVHEGLRLGDERAHGLVPPRPLARRRTGSRDRLRMLRILRRGDQQPLAGGRARLRPPRPGPPRRPRPRGPLQRGRAAASLEGRVLRGPTWASAAPASTSRAPMTFKTVSSSLSKTIPIAPATTGSTVATMAALPAPRCRIPKVYRAKARVVCTTESMKRSA